ncbi:MAG: hypothetical protein NVS1B11_17920 [Terriglobales bacterium]
MPPLKTLDLARRILAFEDIAGKASKSREPAAVLVYQKLRAQLCALTGVAGYQAILSRALTLAKAEAPSLKAAQVKEDGYVEGLSDTDPQIDKHAREGEAILLAQLLGLLLIFIGESLTLRLVREVAPHLTVITKPSTSSPFETILQEADQLQNLSERLESLADQHPVVGDALMSVAANISNTATFLEVLVHIRDESSDSREKVLKQQAKFHVM